MAATTTVAALAAAFRRWWITAAAAVISAAIALLEVPGVEKHGGWRTLSQGSFFILPSNLKQNLFSVS